jgi:hypothetical protein
MRIVLLGLLFVNLLTGQSHRDLLLQESRTIRGLVVDQRGIPVENAEIAHARIRPNPVGGRTDSEGRFQVTTNSPAIVFRKSGYSSVLLRTTATTANGEHRLVMNSTKRVVSRCVEGGKYESLERQLARFRFKSIPQIKVEKQRKDLSYVVQFYNVATAQGKHGIKHGSGPWWSLGLPKNSDVWKSVTFEEDSIEVEGLEILDSRGEWADGTSWRSVGTIGETATYSGMDKETTVVLNRFLDGLCVAAIPPSLD